MHLDHYKLKVSETTLSYEFVSVGFQGAIVKLIQFTPIENGLFYNVAFGDKNLLTGELDDRAVTNNGDSEKVLTTVVAAIYDFCKLFPNVWIYATGSTKSRTRLYRMGIHKHYETVNRDFLLLGQINDEGSLSKNGRTMMPFFAGKKTLHLDYEERRDIRK